MIDFRVYKYEINKLIEKWKNGKKEEYLAMKWISDQIFEKFNINKKKGH